jgi:hypothetical protein
MNTQEMMMLASILSGMSMLYEDPRKQKKTFRLGGQAKEELPWYNIQLSKSERKGKSCQEIQLLRCQKWERQCKKALAADQNLPREIMAVKLV